MHLLITSYITISKSTQDKFFHLDFTMKVVRNQFLIVVILHVCFLPKINTKIASEQTQTRVNANPAVEKLPNIVILLADDLGIGDVGCFGNDTIKTPNIDSICKRGVKLSQHLAADATCTPSRSALLTGRLPVRTGMATNGLIPVTTLIACEAGLPPNETTFSSQLKAKGYNTAFIGKWHLGLSCKQLDDYCHHPLKHGFDYFFGLPLSNFRNMKPGDDHLVFILIPNIISIFTAFIGATLLSLVFIKRTFGVKTALTLGLIFFSILGAFTIFFASMRTLNGIIMRNYEVIEQPYDLDKNLAERLVREGIRYLETNAVGSEKPFLLYMSWVQVHNALHASKKFQGKSNHGHYGDDVEEMDWSVGQILNALEKFKLMDNTIVYFSSDNGGHIEEHHRDGYRTGGYNGIFRGSKAQGGQEGGIREPSAIMWPGKIPAGQELEVPTSHTDIFPTLLAAAGISLPQDRYYDGKDLMPWLTNQAVSPPHKFLFHHCGVWLHAVRYTPGNGDDVFKVYFYWPDWNEGIDGCDFACSCQLHHHKLDIPKITNVQKDPREIHPLDPNSNSYKDILREVKIAVTNFKNTLTTVPNQLEGMGVFKFRPWLQPCCSMPFCQCDNDTTNALNYKAPWEIEY